MKKIFLSIVLVMLMGSFALAQPLGDGGLKQWSVFEDSVAFLGDGTADDTSATITIGNYNLFQLFSYPSNINGTADSIRCNYYIEASWDATNFFYFDSLFTVTKADSGSWKRYSVPDSLEYYPYIRIIAQADSSDETDSTYYLTRLLMMEKGQ